MVVPEHEGWAQGTLRQTALLLQLHTCEQAGAGAESSDSGAKPQHRSGLLQQGALRQGQPLASFLASLGCCLVEPCCPCCFPSAWCWAEGLVGEQPLRPAIHRLRGAPISLLLSSDFKRQGHIIPFSYSSTGLPWGVLMSGFPSWLSASQGTGLSCLNSFTSQVISMGPCPFWT